MGKSRSKRKRRRRGGGTKKRGGVMMGMRGGFRNVANSVVGSGDTRKKGSWLGTAVTVGLVVAAAALLLSRL